MTLLSLAGPDAFRSHAAHAAAVYTQIARDHSEANRHVGLAAQHAADTHRVIATMWGKASTQAAADSAFFSLASTLTAAALTVATPPVATTGQMAALWRARWSDAAEQANLPLAFPGVVLADGPVPDLARARAEHLGYAEPDQYVQARREDARRAGVLGLLAGIDAYLVDAAVAVGDEAFFTVHARWAWLTNLIKDHTPYETALEHARTVLGPVETIRARAYVSI